MRKTFPLPLQWERLGEGTWRAAAAVLALLLTACGTAAPAPTGAASKPAQVRASGLTHVKVALTSKATGGLYLYVGRNLGIFQKHGLDAEIVIGQSAALVTGLNQGDLDFMGTIPSAIQGAEQGLPIRGVFVAKDHPEYVLVGDTGITQISQLKGKELSGSVPTQLPTQMLQQLLRLNGLQPSDYTVIPVADDNARTALVQQHRVAAGILGLSQAMPLLDAGHPLLDTTLEKVYNPSNGLATTMTTIQNRRELVQRAVDAALEATHVAATDKARTTDVLMKEFGHTEANASRVFDLLKPSYTQNGRASSEGIKFQLETDAKAMELPKPKTEADVYDWSFLPK
jgi:ABC-type nitrate/sulfonate/bicarbonate transport system substrate-binding protein